MPLPLELLSVLAPPALLWPDLVVVVFEVIVAVATDVVVVVLALVFFTFVVAAAGAVVFVTAFLFDLLPLDFLLL